MRSIRLEILRQGPPHNQLLSPLTAYLALCENHQAAPVQIPLEHREFLLRLDALRYRKGTEESRPLELEDLARPITGVFGGIPGLIREFATQATDASGMFHLRLILSANELALLPFEISDTPAGVGGSGQSLLLQTVTPVCITREVRRITEEDIYRSDPPRKLKILFAAATAGGPIPLEAHLLALRQVIEPWMLFYQQGNDAEMRKRLGEHLTVLPQASIRQIEEACSTGEYTHVHILAHGLEIKKGYGIALHHSSHSSRTDVVDGARLAKALRTSTQDASRATFARPFVVTLATCDSGAVRSVIDTGASIAHALHEDGIPLVVASQYPLSFDGSIVMVRELYKGFLCGQDPRLTLVGLRRQLKTQVLSTHDWASLVAYASFPPGVDRWLQKLRVRQASRRMDAAFSHADRILWLEGSQPHPVFEAYKERLREAQERMESLLKEPGQDGDLYGMLASGEKRLAQILWYMAGRPAGDQFWASDVRDHLVKSKNYYMEAFRKDSRQAWALVQALALCAVLQRYNPQKSIPRDEWEWARIVSEDELKQGDQIRKAWAHANLMELYLLAPLVIGFRPADLRGVHQKAEEHARHFQSVADLSWVEIHSTKRQFMRYPQFFCLVNAAALGPMAERARALVKDFPESARFVNLK
jgi:hypothetical protein